jgi:signal transduction histidine kinase
MRGELDFVIPDVRPDRNQLRINFVGLSFASGEVLRYQYKLEGADRDWSGPTEQRAVNYARLSPGHYRFMVRAVNSDGVISSLPASITFTVLPPFWQRGWFMFLVICIVGLLVYALYRYRIARVLELSNVRTRIASDLHDDIGANLTKISILSEVARQQLGSGNGETDTPLASIARISRESVTAMSDIVWAINPQRDSTRDLIRRMRLHAEETCLPNHIDLVFEAPEKPPLKLGIETRRNVYLVFKEAINNAARHSDCSRIRVALSFDRAGLSLEIGDNGSGFDATTETDGNGLLSMRRRAASLGGELEIDSRVGGGTMVRLRLSFAQSQK